MALPAAALYPLAQRNRRRGTERAERFFNKWLDLAMRTAERGGPVIVKLCQWASSRPDIFGTDFCDTFKRLQDDTKPHSWEYTERFLEEAYGGDWMDHLKVDKNTILGSGCMAQVYKAVITNDDGSEQPVAVKVMHPNVRKTIAKDLRILRYLARTAENLPFGYGDKLKWNNLAGNMEDFAEMLVPQLDLRKEANHIERFNKNFASTPSVVFPKLVPGYEPNENVLVETFCEGTPIDQWCREHADDVELRSQLGYIGAETMCRMIFEHNFVHGDVHPGNILISPDNEMILLDCGMVNEYSDTDHDLLINIIAAFIRLNGRRAGELMVDDSNQRMAEQGEYAREVDLYLDEMEKISSAANKSGFLLEKVSTYVNFIFNSAAKHHVQMNSGFVSIALAIKVQEGVALMLDDKAQIIGIANPIIMKAEAKRMNQGGFERILRIAKDTFRDVKVRWERESDARRLAAQGTAENSR
jgi:aarF domain-containing kinase